MKVYVVISNHILEGVEVLGVLPEKPDANAAWDFAFEKTERAAEDFKKNCVVNCLEHEINRPVGFFNSVMDVPAPRRKVHFYMPIDDHWVSGFYSEDIDDFLSVETRERLIGPTHWTEQPSKPMGV